MNRNYNEAIKVMQRATAVPRKTAINFHDEVSTYPIISLVSSAHPLDSA